MSALILVDDVVLAVDHIVSMEPVVEQDRAGQPVLCDGAPKVVGAIVTMTPGNAIKLDRTPEEIGGYIAEVSTGRAS